MGSTKNFLILYLFLLCLVLYFSVYYKNLNQQTGIFKGIRRTQPTIPTIVTYSKRSQEIDANCPQRSNSRKTISISHRNQWQTLKNSSTVYLYSAYIDKRKNGESYVRILAMSKGKTDINLFCRIWHNEKKSSVLKVEKQELWISSWDSAQPSRYYVPILLSCRLPEATNPYAVSATSDPCETTANFLQLIPVDATKIKQEFVVCLKPLDFEKDISSRLLEWLELQFILGADIVSIYIYQVHPQTWKLLKHYEKTGKVTIKKHSLPGDEPNDPSKRSKTLATNIWQKRRHEMIIYNDCFYDHIHTHKFVINLDLDEAIIPIINDSWKNMLKHATLENPYILHSASISAANVYFFDSLGVCNDDSTPSYMHMLRHVYRSANFTPPGFAQKSFFPTNNSIAVSNHYTIVPLRPHLITTTPIGKRFVQLHHYRRRCPPLMEDDCEQNYMKFKTKDTVIWKFKDILIKNTKQRIRNFNLTEYFKSLAERVDE